MTLSGEQTVPSYWILMEDRGNAGAVIDALPDSDIPAKQFHAGTPLGDAFPQPARLRFSRNFPDNTRLLDFVSNILHLLIVSPRVRSVFDQAGVTNVEYLPVALHDHGGELVSDEYAIANVLGSEDIIDMEKSDYRMGHLDRTQIKRVKHLVVDAQAVDRDARLFRASNKRTLLFIDAHLRELLTANRLSGYRLFDADGWDGLAI